MYATAWTRDDRFPLCWWPHLWVSPTRLETRSLVPEGRTTVWHLGLHSAVKVDASASTSSRCSSYSALGLPSGALPCKKERISDKRGKATRSHRWSRGACQFPRSTSECSSRCQRNPWESRTSWPLGLGMMMPPRHNFFLPDQYQNTGLDRRPHLPSGSDSTAQASTRATWYHSLNVLWEP